MFVILFYDVYEKRCNKMLKICRKYLEWVQNSVLEGELTESTFVKLQYEINDLIEDDDSVIIYTFRSMKYSKRIVIGQDKKGDSQFL